MSTPRANAVPVPSLPEPAGLNLPLHLGLLGMTVVTTTAAGMLLATRPGSTPAEQLLGGLGFSFTLLAILLTHEMGHYLFARLHRVETSLPFVIPMLPGITFGTLGAVIRMRSPIDTREALVDIGASGPIFGALVALPLLALGLSWSQLVTSPTGDASFWFGHQTVLTLLRDVLTHAPEAASHGVSLGDNLLMRGMTRLVFGPLAPGQDVLVHPVAHAAWFGLLVTSLNLFPIGQLDGGHVAYAVFGPRGHRLLGRAMVAIILALALFSSITWCLWFVVTGFVLGTRHPPVASARVPLGTGRLAIAGVSLLLFLVTFIPVPMDPF